MTPIIFNTRDELIKVDIEKMVYAMAEDNYVHLFFHNTQHVIVCMTMQSLERLIMSARSSSGGGSFTRLGRRYIVNNAYIMHINIPRQQLVLSDLATMKPIALSVSKEALKTLKQTLTNAQQTTAKDKQE